MNTYKYDSNEYNEWNKGNLLSKNEFPLIVYHGTKEGGYEHFDPDEGLNSEACTNGIDAGLGVFWTEEKEHAEIYTSNPYGAAYYNYNPYMYRGTIKMTNPYKIDSEEVYLKVEEHGNAVNFREYLKNEGYDGVIIDFGNKNEYVTFYSDQVNVFEAKSLLKNKNTIKNKP